MTDIAIYVLLFAAIAIGWALGRRGAAAVAGKRNSVPELPSQYYKGLNYLLDGKQDGAIDAFIDALEVNSETLETHIALGNLLRKKGEVDRAIRIHQNLLARPSLSVSHLHHAHLELARDYISAGLLDRAERLLQDLVEESSEQKVTSLHHLLEIYQDERDWGKAIAIAKRLLPRKPLLLGQQSGDRSILVNLSHYCCELAQEKIEVSDWRAARTLVKEALEHDRNCVRASIMSGEIECSAGNIKLAIKALKRVRFQDPEYIPETVEVLRRCYRELDDISALHSYLHECMEYYPSVTLMLSIADDVRQLEGELQAADFVAKELKQSPSLRGLSALIRMHVDNTSGKAKENLTILQQLVEHLIADRPTYRCNHCGFSGKKMHWYCPGCKQWGTIKTIRGTEGD